MRFARLVTLSLLATTCLTGCDMLGKKRPAAGAASGAGTTQGSTGNPGLAENRRTLFDRLGGTQGVTRVVDDFVTIASADPKVNFLREGHARQWEATPENVALLKKRLVQFVGTATGGGEQEYTGQDMVTAHAGMGITNAEFDASAAALKAAMEKNNVAPQEQAELLAVVNKTRSAIVEEQATPGEAPAKDDATGSPTPAPDAAPTDAPAPEQPAVPAPPASDVIEETELEPPAPREGDQPVKTEPAPPTVEQGE